MCDLAKVYVNLHLSIHLNCTDDTTTTPQQQVFYSLFNTLKKNFIPEGYALLWMLKCYLELDALIGLDIHMERTLSMIESELLIFNDILKVSTLKLDPNWPIDIQDLNTRNMLNWQRNQLYRTWKWNGDFQKSICGSI